VLPTDLTVSAIVENDGQFLIVEERASGVIVLNQPSGHIEAGESPEQAAERETLEESGCIVSVTGLLGVYLWIHPQTRQNYLRIAYVAELLSQDIRRELDDAIHAVHWFTRSDLLNRKRSIRTPIVLRSIDDFLAGRREPATKLDSFMPVQQHVHEVLASADLV
jgi:8-oxo-dGTP pyrophosphatase MutT (NUDIX family)